MNSLTHTVKLVLATITIVLAIVISFYIGRATAPQVATTSQSGASADSSQTQSGGPSRDVQEPQFSPSQTDPKVLSVLRDQPRRDPEDPRALGDVDAPVVMVMYEDFSCPMCTSFTQHTLPQLQSYIDQGKLRVEFNDIVIFTRYGSDLAAKGARAAAAQGKFWEFTKKSFLDAGEGNHPEYTDDSVIALAESVGVADMDKFRADYESVETRAAVQEDSRHAQMNLGIKGTPFFIINDAVITGGFPLDYFVQTIENQMKEA